MLVVAATPIGNVGDASARLRELLVNADVIAAEDTRKLADLTRRLGVRTSGRVVVLHDHNEEARCQELVATAEHSLVLVVSDAGMPSVSDPGFRVVRAGVAAGVPVTCAPGPSAVLAALVLSGLSTDRFCFEGFLPRKQAARAAVLSSLATEARTMVFFESPHRVVKTLVAMALQFGGQRMGAVCRELTKTHEEVQRGTLDTLVTWSQSKEMLGEFVVVVAGAADEPGDIAAALMQVNEQVLAGDRLKDAVRAVAKSGGWSVKELYDAAIKQRVRGS